MSWAVCPPRGPGSAPAGEDEPYSQLVALLPAVAAAQIHQLAAAEDENLVAHNRDGLAAPGRRRHAARAGRLPAPRPEPEQKDLVGGQSSPVLVALAEVSAPDNHCRLAIRVRTGAAGVNHGGAVAVPRAGRCAGRLEHVPRPRRQVEDAGERVTL
eukprot:scaffold5659_cov121-Isochrysis_galbana.AAC.4